MSKREATIERKTAETDIKLTVVIDGEGVFDIETGLGFSLVIKNHVIPFFTHTTNNGIGISFIYSIVFCNKVVYNLFVSLMCFF